MLIYEGTLALQAIGSRTEAVHHGRQLARLCLDTGKHRTSPQ
jgi:hypothetical protein